MVAYPIWGLPNYLVSAISGHVTIDSRVAVDGGCGGGRVLSVSLHLHKSGDTYDQLSHMNRQRI